MSEWWGCWVEFKPGAREFMCCGERLADLGDAHVRLDGPRRKVWSNVRAKHVEIGLPHVCTRLVATAQRESEAELLA